MIQNCPWVRRRRAVEDEARHPGQNEREHSVDDTERDTERETENEADSCTALRS